MHDTRELRVTGWSRYLDVAFLSVWLLFWLVGEGVALAAIAALLASAVSAALGHPLALATRVAPTDGSVSPVLLFFLGWGALWTVGGVAAGTHLLRRLAGTDRVTVAGDALYLAWRAGPFTRRRSLPQSSLHRLRLRHHDHAVVADTTSGVEVIAELGTVDDRRALHAWLAARLRLPDDEAARRREAATPPPDRDVAISGHTTIVTFPKRRHRRLIAAIAWTVVALMALGWIDAVRRGAPPTTGEWVAVAVTLLVAAGAAWFSGQRAEWTLAPGSIGVRRVWRHRVVRDRVFTAASRLAVEHERDSDGDDRYTLTVKDDDRRQVLASDLNDAATVLALGEWLAARSGLPFTRLDD